MKSVDEISREIFTKEIIERINQTSSYQDYMRIFEGRFIYFYKKYNDLTGYWECNNCCAEVDNKRWCSFECFLSDIGA
jgi:hypothetical protein